jgi:hypothetical protein
MTKFKAMTMDEQVETIEHTTQEAIRIREENRAAEATKAWKRGTLLLEEAERAMQILREYPPLNPLVRPSRITPTDTNGQEAELMAQNSSTRRDIVAQENTSPISAQVGSPVTTTTQRREVKASSEDGYAYHPHRFNHHIR